MRASFRFGGNTWCKKRGWGGVWGEERWRRGGWVFKLDLVSVPRRPPRSHHFHRVSVWCWQCNFLLRSHKSRESDVRAAMLPTFFFIVNKMVWYGVKTVDLKTTFMAAATNRLFFKVVAYKLLLAIKTPKHLTRAISIYLKTIDTIHHHANKNNTATKALFFINISHLAAWERRGFGERRRRGSRSSIWRRRERRVYSYAPHIHSTHNQACIAFCKFIPRMLV